MPRLRAATSDSAPARLLRDPRLSLAARRVAALARRIPVPLAIVLGIAVLLRIALSLAIHPAVMNNVDSTTYVGMAGGALFTDPVHPAGYSIFLRAVAQVVSTDLDITIAIQHLMGIGSALLIYAAVRRTGGPVWAGVFAAAAVLLSLDQIYLEHTLLAETLFTLLLTAALYASVRSLDPARRLAGTVTSRHLWIVSAGALLGLAAWVRVAGAPLVPFLALWLVFALPGRWWERVGRGALAGATAALVVLGYAALNSANTGYFGLTDGSGRVLYGRAAIFADCSQFDPPAGTSELCEGTPTEERLGSDYYIWDRKSPAYRVYGPPPGGDGELGAFGREAIISQPWDYTSAVFTDSARHFSPGFNDERVAAGTPYDWMKIDRRDEEEQFIEDSIGNYYPNESLVVHDSAGTLGDLQDFLRVQPTLMLLATILAGIGIWLSAGRVRAVLVLLLGASLLLLIIPSLTATYNARYAIPIGGPFIAAGAIGVWVMVERAIERRSRNA